jgi:tRNA A-37 threonylcarbamoyl transferase component Bud32|tara:strand:- start:985 stop:1500 length:516 start_codon:yes stop_codon:yes gene_type:complete
MSDDFRVLRQLGQDGAQGVVSMVEFPNGLRAAMKQFKPTKSSARIRAEADFQKRAAEAGIAPDVMHVDEDKKRIFMEPMSRRIVDVIKGSHAQFRDDLLHIMQTLDDIGILHNDGNALNLMLDCNDKLQLLDYGLSKNITDKVRKKWEGEPNTRVTLHMLRKSLRKYRITV